MATQGRELSTRGERAGRRAGLQGAVALGAAGLGAAAMYLLDPEAGRRRRKELAQRTGGLSRRAGEGAGRAARDIGNRARGWAASAGRLVRGDDATGERLAARVRSRLGRVVSHPHAIDVSVEDGRLVLAGPILASEVDAALAEAARVRGVDRVDNELDVFESAEGVPALQGGSTGKARPELMQQDWTPGVRMLAAASGGAALAYGARRGGALGSALGIGGAALAVRALANKPLARLAGAGRTPGLVRVAKTVIVDAPVSRVFDLWSRYDEFPRFMSGVKEVRGAGDGRSTWRVEGPAGVDVTWEAETTEYVPGRRIAWRSLPGSTVSNSGSVHFEPVGDGEGTRVSVHLRYDPPAGQLGQVVAKAFGADAKSRLEEDLQRMKSFVETGRGPHDAARL